MSSNRLQFLKGLLAGIFLLLVGQLFYLQVLCGGQYVQLAENNRIRLLTIPAARGKFLDRNGLLLVSNRPSFSVEIANMGEPVAESVVVRLSQLLDRPVTTIREQVAHHSGGPFVPIQIQTEVTPEIVTKIEENQRDLPGVIIKVRPVREYPYQQLAAHLLGYVGEVSADELARGVGYRRGDILGKMGIEQIYDSYIRGTDGAERIEVDATGYPIQELTAKKPIAGNNVQLTLDLVVQQSTEKALDAMLDKLLKQNHRSQAKGAAAVAIDPKTGEILAIVSRPAFDPNWFNGGISTKNWALIKDNPFHPMQNRVISGEYPPGSIFKIITGTAALELGKVTTKEKIFDAGQHWMIGKRNAGGEALGWISFQEALAKSDNVYFYEMGYRLGIDNLARYAQKFGLGATTGIALTGEAPGLVASRQYKEKIYQEPWYIAETFDAAIGQGFQLTTPLQLAVVMGEVATGGYRYKPLLVRKIISPTGVVYKEFSPEIAARIDISSPTLVAIRNALHEAVRPGGTAGEVFGDFPIAVAGKTGTAENAQGDDHSWFVGYAPFEDPKIVVAVLIEHGGYGSQSAAPVAREMLAAYFRLASLPESPTRYFPMKKTEFR